MEFQEQFLNEILIFHSYDVIAVNYGFKNHCFKYVANDGCFLGGEVKQLLGQLKKLPGQIKLMSGQVKGT